MHLLQAQAHLLEMVTTLRFNVLGTDQCTALLTGQIQFIFSFLFLSFFFFFLQGELGHIHYAFGGQELSPWLCAQSKGQLDFSLLECTSASSVCVTLKVSEPFKL